MTLLSRLRAILGLGRSAAPPAPAEALPIGAVPVHAVGDKLPTASAASGGPTAGLSGHDLDILTRTLWGEARGEPRAGQIAVVHVIRNRALHRRTSAAVECQRPWQFSCWNRDDPNRAPMLALRVDHPDYLRLRDVAEEAWAMQDTTQGARHYYAISMHPPPTWSTYPGAKAVMTIGGHIFLRGVP